MTIAKLKTIGVAGMMLAVTPFFSVAMGQTVDLYYGPYAYDVGGEFTAVTDPVLFNQYYASSTLVNVGTTQSPIVGFETFCVQTGVDFTPYNWGNTAPYSISESLNSIGLPDAFHLTAGTAWLYSQFAQGTLAGYDYANTGTGTSVSSPGLGATRSTDAGTLQAAFWYLQGDQSYNDGHYPTGGAGNLYYDEALAALGGNAGNLTKLVNLSDNYGVEVLNLSYDGSPAQNQLVYMGSSPEGGGNPVPDKGATAVLLLLSFGFLGFFSARLGVTKRA